jgi:hypothetical protein
MVLAWYLRAVHGIVSLFVASWALARMHPLVRTGEIGQPSRALIGYGRMTPVSWIGAHRVRSCSRDLLRRRRNVINRSTSMSAQADAVAALSAACDA